MSLAEYNIPVVLITNDVPGLIKGSSYMVKEDIIYKMCYVLMGPDGFTRAILKYKFKHVSEFREETIDQILL